jgi:hypothetical protein
LTADRRLEPAQRSMSNAVTSHSAAARTAS